MSLTINLNDRSIYENPEKATIIGYNDYNRIRDDPRIKSFLASIKEQANGHHLKATFTGSYNAFRSPKTDLDNFLLYNMRLSTSGFQSITLEKIIIPNATDIKYEYFINNEQEELVGEYSIVAEINGIEYRGTNVTVFFYNKFREWLCERNGSIQSFNASPIELIIEYNGPHTLSESSFLKHAVDGIVSAMQRCNLNSEELNPRNVYPIDTDLSILNGDNVISIRNERVNWHPQDHLVYKLVVIKNPGLECYLRIRIRAFNN